MSDLKPRMVIFVEGGIIQDISCDTAIEVAILDSDTDGIGESEIMKIKDWDGKEEEYFKGAYPIRSYDPEPEVVEHFFSQVRTIADADGQEALDELVHDAMSKKAANINNQGRDAQIEFLKSEGWTDEQIKEAMMP